MDLLQSWIVVGVPGLVIAAGLFVGRSRTRALIGYGVLLALVAYFFTVPGGGLSAAIVGLVGVVFVATGRGTNLDAGSEEHHEQRRQYTVAQARDET
jgi:hypothetical protein